MSYQIAEFYEYEAEIYLERLVSMIEPIMIIVVGIITAILVISVFLPMLSPKDLNGLMDLEIEDMISLDSDKYTFSYEVSREIKNDEESKINVILAGVLKEEIYEIDNIFKQYKLEREAVDTIATSYLRVLKHVAYDDIMIMNIE